MADYDLKGLQVLLIEDNINMRDMIRSVLFELGIRNIAVAHDGDSALREMKTNTVDLVLCDWVMKPINGPMFVKRIRRGKDSPNQYIPIIMLTGHTDLDKVYEARDIGVNEFLAKPFTANKLYTRIKSVIENDRKFVKTASYFGPDRRRSRDKVFNGKNRRKS
jgi:DNA-binding response OmpR family regulator